ncbi:MAG: ATP synthase F1 subunit delta [Proteobacteria bacterium]|nr:ATP synthase F1 subunit delta [Pseudomonadota bacterium]
MAISTLSKRYASTLLEIGVEEKSFEAYGTELRNLYAISQSNPEFVHALSNPMFKVEERKALATEVLEKLGTSDMVKRFIGVLIDNAKVSDLDDICDAYFALEDDLKGRVRVIVETPAKATDEFLTSLKERLGTETGKEVIVSHTENPELLGGFVVKIGNVLLDASLKVQLEHIKEKIVEGVV